MPPDLVETVIEDQRWVAAGLAVRAERAGRATLVRLGLPAEGFEIALLAADDARIAQLNGSFRGKAAPTNVLSWPAAELPLPAEGDDPPMPRPGSPGAPRSLGDIALAYETCAAEAAAAEKPLADHATHLVVHATLHLFGYDHSRDGDAARMEALEVEILASLGLGNPYS